MVADMSNGLDEILADAKIMAQYGQRAGRLKSAQLFEAIAAFESIQFRSWKAPEAVALQQALTQAAADIAPTTLSDIKRRDPFGPKDPKDFFRTGFLIAFSIVLMVATAYFTVLYNRGSELAILLQDIDKSKPAEKMAAVAREWNSAKFDDGASSETYFKMLDELRGLDARVKTYLSDYADFKIAIQALNPASWFRSVSSPGNQANYPSQPVGCGQVPSGANASNDPVETVNLFVQKPPGKILNDNKALILNFACAEALTISPYSMPWLASLGGQIEKMIKVLGYWVLPGLYGALGATIFYMRAILNPVVPDPPIEQIVHRVALGAFSGIIFAWFWAPSPRSTEQLAGLTMNSFAIAFVIGFSIDVLFALLDRLVQFLNGVVAQSGQGEQRPVTAMGPNVSGPAITSMPHAGSQKLTVVRSVTPVNLTRGPKPTTLTLTGENLSGIDSVVLKQGQTQIEATQVVAVANQITCNLLLEADKPVGAWFIEVSEPTGGPIRATQTVSVA